MKLSMMTVIVCALFTSMGWAEGSVYTNAKGLVTKPGLDRSMVTFPDVNKVPRSEAGFVPIPYPNVGSLRDTQSPSRKVKVGSGKVQIKNKRYFKREVDRQPYYQQLPARTQP